MIDVESGLPSLFALGDYRELRFATRDPVLQLSNALLVRRHSQLRAMLAATPRVVRVSNSASCDRPTPRGYVVYFSLISGFFPFLLSQGSSPNFEFTSVPSPPSAPPHRPLKLEIADDIHGKGRSWEVCADEPSHRLLTSEVKEEQDDELIPPAVAATEKSRSVGPNLAGGRNGMPHVTSSTPPSFPVEFSGTRSRPRGCPSAHIKTAEDDSSSVVHHRRQNHRGVAPPKLPSVSSTLSSAPFDWRVGPACRGATGTRYRIHHAEPPIPVPVPSPIEVDVKVKLEPDDDGIKFPLSPGSSTFEQVLSDSSSSNNSTIHKGPVIVPPILFRPRSLHALYGGDHVADRKLPTPTPSIPGGSGISSFKASPFTPLGLSPFSPFYPSSRRWSIDSGASSSVSTTSTAVSSHKGIDSFTRNPSSSPSWRLS